jgi:hypothetical protein
MSFLKKIGAVLGALVASTSIAHASASARASVGEPVKVARAHARFVHTAPKFVYSRWDGKFIALADRAAYIAQHGGFVQQYLEPAYVDDDGTMCRGQRFIAPDVLDPRDHVVLWEDDALNVKTTAGIDFIFAQSYSTSTGANGLNYIALSNDSLTETSGSTTLSTEIAANGLTRAQGTYAHSNGASTATVSHTFTCATSSQACQKAALFTASSSGTMNHALSFTQRTLQVGDSIAVTFTITIT